jgi:Nucleotidyl transferase AbiEii toxin, Type IV TA system
LALSIGRSWNTAEVASPVFLKLDLLMVFTPRLDILPPAQRRLWPDLVQVPGHFVLYGGTAIALRLGHRQSVDFDFFSHVDLDGGQKNNLLSEIPRLNGASVLQNEKDTSTVSVDHMGAPIKVSFVGGVKHGCVCEPDKTDDDVLCVASMDALFAHKLKVIDDRAEAKDYQDIAVMLANGQSLPRGLAALEALFGSSVPPMITLKSLAYFNDLNEPWRLTDDMKATITTAISGLPNTWEKIAVFSQTLCCRESKNPRP